MSRIEPVRAPLLGPNGRPLVEKVTDHSKVVEKLQYTREQLLMAGARMLRDGKSLANIRAELGLPSELVPNAILERALTDVGMPLLKRAIAEGREPEETIIREMVDPITLEPDDDDMTDPTGVNNVSKGYLEN